MLLSRATAAAQRPVRRPPAPGGRPEALRAAAPRRCRRRGAPARATAAGGGSGGEGGGEGDKPDIDQLAAFLSQKALEMRASMDELDMAVFGGDSAAADEADGDDDDSGVGGGRWGQQQQQQQQPASPALPAALSTQEVLDEMGEGGFITQDFQIVRILGRLGMQDAAAAASEPGSGGATPSGRAPPALAGLPAAVAYAARYNSGLPYEGPVTVQLREYLPGSRRVAAAELAAHRRLCGELPEEKWKAAVKEPAVTPPVVRLLGFLEAPPSDEVFAMTDDPADTLWLVYTFQGLKPLSMMLQQMDLPEEPAGLMALFQKKEAAVAAALAARRALLRRIARGLLEALSYAHRRGVAHCGLGPGSVVLNTWADRDAERVVVKLDNFGLARVYSAPLEEEEEEEGGEDGDGGEGLPSQADSDAAQQRQQDLQAAGLLLAEVFAVGAAAEGAEVMDLPALKRLLFDVFHEDISLFKEYCAQDPDSYGGFVEFMDDGGGAGWELLEALLAGRTPAGRLLREARFFAPAGADVPAE